MEGADLTLSSRPAKLAGARGIMLAGLCLLGACTPEPTPAEKAAADARAVAEVEAIQKQKPPPRPIMLQPILFDDIQAHNLFGAGCAFAPGGSMGAVLMAQDKVGYLKLRGRIVGLASDPGSTRLPVGAWSNYVGKEFAVRLTRADRVAAPEGAESLRWPGHLTVTDAYDQAVYDEDGSVQCSS